MAKPAILVVAAIDGLRKSNVMRISALIGELGRVLKQQDWPVARSIPHLGRFKMTSQDLTFLHLRIGQEPVSRLGIRPILAGQRDRPAHSVAQAAQQVCTAPPQSRILKGIGINLAL